jgi:hypothetical protein
MRRLRPCENTAYSLAPHNPQTAIPLIMYLRSERAAVPARRIGQARHQTQMGVLVEQRLPVAGADDLALTRDQAGVERLINTRRSCRFAQVLPR